eukprot:m.333338 g.333338  ORF g.333338 m.333338 type:complete len:235 (+) comp17126_c0_seq1:230-934(+)
MAKSVVKLTPETDLNFDVAPETGAEATIKLQNFADEQVMFKVKTTAPNKYIVKPNSGCLKARETGEVKVTLRPLGKGDEGKECKDKFLVQTLKQSSVDASLWNDNVWKATEKEASSLYMQNKIKCHWRMKSKDNKLTVPETTAPAAPAASAPVQEKPTPPLTKVQKEPVPENKPAPTPAPVETTDKTPRRRKQNTESKPPAVAPPQPASAQDQARIYLLIAAFIIGILVGKFVM